MIAYYFIKRMTDGKYYAGGEKWVDVIAKMKLYNDFYLAEMDRNIFIATGEFAITRTIELEIGFEFYFT